MMGRGYPNARGIAGKVPQALEIGRAVTRLAPARPVTTKLFARSTGNLSTPAIEITPVPKKRSEYLRPGVFYLMGDLESSSVISPRRARILAAPPSATKKQPTGWVPAPDATSALDQPLFIDDQHPQ
jgi:hypothetical protein